MRLKKYKDYPSSKKEALVRAKELKAYLLTKFKGPFRINLATNEDKNRWYYSITCGSVEIDYCLENYTVSMGCVKNNINSSGSLWRNFQHKDPALAIAGLFQIVRRSMKGVRMAIRDNQMKLQPKN